MTKPLKVLIVEDNPADAKMLLAELKAAGYEPDWNRIQTEPEFLAEIQKQPDIILSDYSMPEFSGLRAAELLQASGLDIPFILISGTVGEEVAVEAMKHGATDYLLKDRIVRLGSAVERALREAQAHIERKAVEAANIRLAAILEATSDLVSFSDPAGRILYFNHAGRKMLGIGLDEDITKTAIADFIPDPAASPILTEGVPAAIRDGTWSGETSLLSRSGRIIPVSQVILAHKSPTGNLEFLSTVMRDITERKQSEVALRESVRFAQATIDALAAHLCVLDETGKILATNEAWRWFAKSNPPSARRANPGTNYLEVCDAATGMEAAEAATFAEGIRSVIRGERAEFAMEYPCHGPSKQRWFIGRVTRFLDEGPVRAVVVHENITERKRIEESHARLALAVEQASENIVITDTGGTILYANPAFEKTTGYTVAEVLGKNPRILKSGKHDAEFYRRMWDTLKRGDVWRGHLINRHKNGTLSEEEATISPMRNATGKVINYVAVKRDVTREMQLESQFRQSQKMEAIGTLASGVAHDFNNILAVIQMQAELLKTGGGLSAPQLELTGDIVSAVKRAAALTRQLLLFSRKETLQSRDLDLNESVTNLTKMLTRIVGENIEVRLKLAAQPMLAHADAGMMDQVLMNLVVNARDAMPKGGHLIIETAGVEFDELVASQTAQARPGSFVRLSVSDNGCGIPPEILPKIFEPFFTTKDIGKGTGLGLATVFGIAQQHKGWVNVYSEVGQGTTFKVYLPRLAAKQDTEMTRKTPVAVQTGHETILLVEDESALRGLMRTMLTRLGYRVLEASTGVKALEVWQEHRAEIQLLLTDLMMPDGMTGKDLAQRLLPENPQLKVIYMSGYSADIVGKNFPLQEGVNFLTKPFEARKLAQILRATLDGPGPGA